MPLCIKAPRSFEETAKLNARALAYIGDSVYELMMRMHHLEESDNEAGKLHNSIIRFVKASFQATMFERLFEKLSLQEQDLMRTWRNAKLTYRHQGASRGEYARSTAFEALIGFLYLTGQEERLEETVRFCLENDPEQTGIREEI